GSGFRSIADLRLNLPLFPNLEIAAEVSPGLLDCAQLPHIPTSTDGAGQQSEWHRPSRDLEIRRKAALHRLLVLPAWPQPLARRKPIPRAGNCWQGDSLRGLQCR